MRETEKSNWHSNWEKNIYGEGRHLNLYPYHAIVGFLLSNFPSPETRKNINVVEAGCGAGNNLWFAAREGFNVYGIEGSTSAVEFAKKRFSKEKLTGHIVEGDFSLLPWQDKYFDVYIDKGALECTKKQGIIKALDEAKRVLKKGGLLISIMHSTDHPDIKYGSSLGNNDFMFGDTGYFKNLGHIHFTDKQEIMELFGSRFNIKSVIHTIENDGKNDTPLNAFYKIECVNV